MNTASSAASPLDSPQVIRFSDVQVPRTPFPPASRGLNPGWFAVPVEDMVVCMRCLADATQTIALLLDDRARLEAELREERSARRAEPVKALLWPTFWGVVPAPWPAPEPRGEARSVVDVPVPSCPLRVDAPEAVGHVEVDPLSDAVCVPLASLPVDLPTAPTPTARPVVPVDAVWPRPDDPRAEVGPLVAGASRAFLRLVEGSVDLSTGLRRWVTVTARRTCADPVARLERLAELVGALPRWVALQPPTEDVFGVAGACVAEIDGADASAQLRTLAAIDAIAARGADPDGRLFDAAAAAWRARVDSKVPSREHEALLTIAAQQMVAALAADQVERAVLFAEVVRATARAVHPDPVRRSEWLGRAVVRPLRDADVDVRPVRSALTEVSRGVFSGVFGPPPAMTFDQGVDLYLACAEADLGFCADGQVVDACLKALLQRLGVQGLNRYPRGPALPWRRATRKDVPVAARTPTSGRLSWASHELGLRLDRSPHDPRRDGADPRTSSAPTTCPWKPPICRGTRGRSFAGSRRGQRANGRRPSTEASVPRAEEVGAEARRIHGARRRSRRTAAGVVLPALAREALDARVRAECDEAANRHRVASRVTQLRPHEVAPTGRGRGWRGRMHC